MAPGASPRRRGRKRRLLVWSSTAALLAVAVLWTVAESARVAEYVRRRLETATTTRLDRPVRIERLSLRVLPPAMTLNGVAVDGPAPGDDPCLEIERLVIDLDLADLLRPPLLIQQLRVVRPRLRIELREDGSSNLPTWRQPAGAQQSERVDVAVGGLTLRDGELLLNDARVPLDLDASELRAQLVGLGGLRGQGSFEIASLDLHLPGAERYPVALAGRVVAEPGRVELTALQVSGTELGLRARASIAWGEAGSVVAVEAAGDVEADLLPRLGYLAVDTLRGRAAVKTQIDWQHVGSERDGPQGGAPPAAAPGESVWGVRAELRSAELRLFGQRLADVSAELGWDRHGLVVEPARAQWAGGELGAKFRLLPDPVREGRRAELELQGAGIDFGGALAELGLAAPPVAGTLSGEAVYRFDTRAARFGSGTGLLRLLPRATSAQGVVQRSGESPPVEGSLPLVLEEGRIATQGAWLSLPGVNAQGRGDYDLGSRSGSARIEAESSDLSALYEWLAGLGGREQASEPRWERFVGKPTSGSGRLEADLSLSASGGVRGDLSLSLSELRTTLLALDQASGSASIGDGGLENLVVELSHRGGAVLATGTVPFPSRPRTPARSGVATSALGLDVQISSWPLESIAPLLPWYRSLPLHGQLTGEAHVDGTRDGSLRARVVGASLAAHGPRQNPVQPGISAVPGVAEIDLGELELAMAWSPAELRIEDSGLALAAGYVGLAGRIGLEDRQLALRLSARDLDLRAAPFDAVIGQGGDALAASLRVEVSGTLERPQAKARLDTELSALAPEPLEEPGQREGGQERAQRARLVRRSQLLADWDGERLDVRGGVAGLLEVGGGGRLDLTGTELDLELESSDLGGLTELLARLAGWQPAAPEIDAEPALAAALREDLLGGQVDGLLAGRLRASADWSALPPGEGGPSRRDVELVLERFEATYRDVTLANVEPVVVRWELGAESGTTEIVSLFLTERGRGSELIAAGRIGPAGQGYPLRLSLDGELPASWLELLGDEIEARGSFDFLGTVSGTLADPKLNGQGGVRGGELVLPGFPHTFEDVHVALLFFPDRLIVDSARSRCAAGTVRVQGSLVWPREPPQPPAAPARPRIELQARVAGVDLRYPADWSLRGNAELSFRQSSTGERQLVGRVDLEQAVYGLGVDYGIGQLLRGFAAPVRLEVAQVDPFLDSIRLNVEIAGREALRVRNNLADLRGRLDLIVQGTLGRPILFGTVELEPGGTLRYGGDEYQIAQGRLTFADPYETRPLIDLEASTRRRDYRVVLRLSGTRDRLEANLSSDPPLPELEVLGLLAGSTTTSGGDAGLQALGQDSNLAATELLYGTASTLVEERVQNLFGLDRFRINPLRSGDTLSSARVTVGKRLSKDLLVTYSTDPSTTEESVLEVEWQISDRVVLVVSQNADGSYSVDARVEQTL